jgi:hypothetical protein
MSVLDDWNRFLSQNKGKLIGGDLEHIEFPEGAFRGPVSDLIIEGDTLTVVSPWVARIDINSHGLPVGDSWEKVTRRGAERAQYTIMDGIISAPQSIGAGRFHFSYAFARVTFFPKGGSKLDRSKVRGL